MIDSQSVIQKLEKRLSSFETGKKAQNVGVVEKNNDGVIIANGLSKAFAGEIVNFDDGNKGVVLGLDEDNISIILLDKGENLREGNEVSTSGRVLSVKASEDLLGRVINPLGEPLDGKQKISAPAMTAALSFSAI